MKQTLLVLLAAASAGSADMPTDRRLALYRGSDRITGKVDPYDGFEGAPSVKGAADPGLEQLFFQVARYLRISSSRPGSLPSNLQGLWNDTNEPPLAGRLQKPSSSGEILLGMQMTYDTPLGF